jgi:CheY-like chemotaxis protein
VLLDLAMPEMNGHEVARAVRGDEAFGNTLSSRSPDGARWDRRRQPTPASIIIS